jgi:RHS repeat-associated protein
MQEQINYLLKDWRRRCEWACKARTAISEKTMDLLVGWKINNRITCKSALFSLALGLLLQGFFAFPSIPSSALGYGLAINYNSGIQKNEIYTVDLDAAKSTVLNTVAFSSGSWNPFSFAVDANAKLFYAVSADNTLYTFDLTTGSVLSTVKITTSPQWAVMGKSGSIIIPTSSSSGVNFSTINTSNGVITPLNPVNMNGWVLSALCSDVVNSKFYAVSGDNTIYTLDISTGSIISKNSIGISLQSIRMGIGETLIGIGTAGFYSIDPSNGTYVLLGTVSLSGGGYSPQNFSSDPANNKFYILSANNTLYTFDITTADILSNAALDITAQLLVAVSGVASEGISPKTLGDPCDNPGGCGAGDPITISTGNVYERVTDYQSEGQNKLSFTRYYNSLGNTANSGTYAKTLGTNWRSTYDHYLTIASSTVSVDRADGQALSFTLSSGAWVSDSDVDIQLTNSGSTWTLTNHDDSVETFTALGTTGKALLTSIRARDGYTQNLTYNTANQLTSVADSNGRMLQFTYQNNLLQTVTTPGGLVLTYGYSSSGTNGTTLDRLATVTYSTTPAASLAYVYENTSFPFALTGVIDELGNRFSTWAYDTLGRGTSSQHASGVDLTQITYNADGSSTVTNALGEQDTYKFTTLQNVPKVTEIDRAANGTVQAASRLFTYDANGYPASTTDWNGNATAYTNDARGDETSYTEAQGSSVARTVTLSWMSTYHSPTQIMEPTETLGFAYDNNGNMLSRTESAGSQSRTWSYTYNTVGQALTARDPLGNTTAYAYDAQNNLASITDALGHVTKITGHDADGRPTVVVDPNGLTTALGYDARGRLTSRVVGTETTTYAHDAAGNLTKVTLPDGSYLAYTYDAAHRVTNITDALGNQIAYTLNPMDKRLTERVFDPSNTLRQARSHVYDALNRLAQDIGTQGQTTAYGYDNNGNRTGITDPLGRTTHDAYDALNRLIQVTDPQNGITGLGYDANDHLTSVTDPRGLVTAYAYDGLEDLSSAQSPDTGTTTNTYDAAGNVLTSTDARGKTTTYSYDALNRLTKTTFADGKAVTRQYDQGTNGIGRLTSMTDPSGSTTWSYDLHGRVIQKPQQTGTVTLTTSTAYDAAGRIAGITYPSGHQLAYAYDSSGRLSSIHVDGNSLVTNVGYQPFGPVSGWITVNGAAYNGSFDLDGRLTELTLGGNGSDIITLAYDAANRITGITDTGGVGPALVSGSTNYQYPTTSNKLQSSSGAVAQNYTYDAAGNLTGDAAYTFGYDARGRLVQVTQGALTTQYAINGLGQRVGKQGPLVSTGTEYFVYDGAGHLVGEYDATGTVIQETVWLGNLPVGVLMPGAVYYVNSDHLGAPRSIVDTNGNTVWAWNRDPFGNGQPTGTMTYNLRFPGQYYDAETGLSYNMARDYNPAIGRYIQSDPIGLAGGVNTYAYVGGNPVGGIDPNGLCEAGQSPSLDQFQNWVLGNPVMQFVGNNPNGGWYLMAGGAALLTGGAGAAALAAYPEVELYAAMIWALRSGIPAYLNYYATSAILGLPPWALSLLYDPAWSKANNLYKVVDYIFKNW